VSDDREPRGIPFRAMIPNAITAVALCMGLTGVSLGWVGATIVGVPLSPEFTAAAFFAAVATGVAAGAAPARSAAVLHPAVALRGQ